MTSGAPHCVAVKMHKASAPEHFWKLRCRKKCTLLWREAHSEVEMYKTPHVRATYGRPDVVLMSTKRTLLEREAHLQVKIYKTHRSRSTFGS